MSENNIQDLLLTDNDGGDLLVNAFDIVAVWKTEQGGSKLLLSGGGQFWIGVGHARVLD